MSRPGFVLEVDDRTPPLVATQGHPPHPALDQLRYLGNPGVWGNGGRYHRRQHRSPVEPTRGVDERKPFGQVGPPAPQARLLLGGKGPGKVQLGRHFPLVWQATARLAFRCGRSPRQGGWLLRKALKVGTKFFILTASYRFKRGTRRSAVRPTVRARGRQWLNHGYPLGQPWVGLRPEVTVR